MAENHNPMNDALLDNNSLLNDLNVVRCMFFVKDVLKAVRTEQIQCGQATDAAVERNTAGTIDTADESRAHSSKTATKPVQKERIREFPREAVERFSYREDKGINKLLEQIYEPIADKNYRRITGQMVNDRMKEAGFIKEEYDEALNDYAKFPTDKGLALGLRSEKREYHGKPYMAIIYDRKAQVYFIRNFEKIWNKQKLE